MTAYSKVLSGFLTLTLLSAGAGMARASSINVSVLGTAGPWEFDDLSLNTNMQYGGSYQGNPEGNTPPTVVLLNSLGLSAGQNVFIQYVGGYTEAFGGAIPVADNNGYAGPFLASVYKDGVPGLTGGGFPSQYLPSAWGATQNPTDSFLAMYSGLFINGLVGAFADSAGNVIAPFSVGTVSAAYGPSGPPQDPSDPNAGLSLIFDFQKTFLGIIPAGATQIQLGLNDEFFRDNIGSLQVCVGTSAQDCQPPVDGSVPEPTTMALVAGGLALMARRRKRGAR